ncbi:hypothetical protein ABIE09_002371 [Lysobacter enzymogenes]|uniref:hypothetical protein n=1 Tax=Lysobacter enzymogenes TaxID=69 RepID=UPI00339B206B
MPELSIQTWINSQLDSLLESAPERNALTVTFQLAILRILTLGVTKKIHEEPITGFLLGAFSALAPICSGAFEDNQQCSWQYFPKSGSDQDTEAVSGADFALIIEGLNGTARLAIFQAKLPSSPTSFNVHQIRKKTDTSDTSKSNNTADRKKGSPTSTPQFARLLSYSKIIGYEALKKNFNTNEIHWAHYLIYMPDQLPCISISKLSDIEEKYLEQKKNGAYSSPGTIDISKREPIDLFWLLTNGANPKSNGERLKGWLEIESARLRDIKECLLTFTDVCIASEGPAPAPIPGGDNIASTEDILSKLYNSKSAPEAYSGSLKTPSAAK